MGKMKKIHVDISKEDHALVMGWSKSEKVSLSEAVRQAIHDSAKMRVLGTVAYYSVPAQVQNGSQT